MTWVFGEIKPGDMSELEVRLTAEGADQTLFELEHIATVPPEMWAQYGPGAVGVGWDGAVLGPVVAPAGPVDRRSDGLDGVGRGAPFLHP